MLIHNVSVAGGFCRLLHELVSEFIASNNHIRNKPQCEIVSLGLLKPLIFAPLHNDSCVSVKIAVNSNHDSSSSNKSSVTLVFRLAMLLSHVLTIAVDPIFVVVIVLHQH